MPTQPIEVSRQEGSAIRDEVGILGTGFNFTTSELRFGVI
jgi:hypothetical protein